MVKLTKKWCEDNDYDTKEVPWGYSGLGYVVYKRTYARKKANGMKEEWWETCLRVVNGMQTLVKHYTEKELSTIYYLLFNLKSFPSGRGLWQLGTRSTDKKNGTSLQNCWFTAIDSIESFTFVMDCLMLGGGVGFSVQRKYIYEIPKILKNVRIEHRRTNDTDHIVPDTREGWVELLKKVLMAYLETGEGFTYSTILVRYKGAEVKGFGGEAAGPQVLIEGITNICKIMDRRAGKKLRSVDVLDLCNILGDISEAGARRSAEIAIGDADDLLFLKAKRWDLGHLPKWRSNSNNAIDCSDIASVIDDFWEPYRPVQSEDGSWKAKGECYGLINTDVIQKYARIGHLREDTAIGVNPCGEATLDSYEPCNLSEHVLPNFDNEEEMQEAIRLYYIYQKNVCKMRFNSPKTDAIIKKNYRIGVGLTGLLGAPEREEWIDRAYCFLRDYDIEYSRDHELPISIRLSVIKPSGTLSKLAGCTPGLHGAFSKYWMQTIRISSDDPILDLCRAAGCKIEHRINLDETIDLSTAVVYFPCKAPEGSRIASEMSAIEQLDYTLKMNKIWSDQSSSVTIYYQPHEYELIKNYLLTNWDTNFKALSFSLHSSHGFKQAPYIEISKEVYDAAVAKIDMDIFQKGFEDSSNFEDLQESLECESGHCPIK